MRDAFTSYIGWIEDPQNKVLKVDNFDQRTIEGLYFSDLFGYFFIYGEEETPYYPSDQELDEAFEEDGEGWLEDYKSTNKTSKNTNTNTDKKSFEESSEK